MSSRRNETSRCTPSLRVLVKPASRSTLRWWVRVDFETGTSKLAGRNLVATVREGSHDLESDRIAQRVQHPDSSSRSASGCVMALI